MAQHGTAGHSMAQQGTAGHRMVKQGTAQHGTARHSTAQHGTARHSTAHLQPGHEDLLKRPGHISKRDLSLSRIHVLWEELQLQAKLAGVAVSARSCA